MPMHDGLLAGTVGDTKHPYLIVLELDLVVIGIGLGRILGEGGSCEQQEQAECSKVDASHRDLL
jgi:hypothetical protein